MVGVDRTLVGSQSLARIIVVVWVRKISYSNVNNIQKSKRGNWVVTIKGQNVVKSWMLASKYLFIGAGGGTLPLLEKANIKEAKGYGGFPISGLWLRCTNPEIIEIMYPTTIPIKIGINFTRPFE